MDMIKESICCTNQYSISRFDFREQPYIFKFKCSYLPFQVPQSINWILDYFKMQIYMLYMALNILINGTKYDIVVVDSISLALPVLRLQSKKLLLFLYQDNSAPQMVEDLFLQNNSRFQYYSEKLWCIYCFITNIVNIICLAFIDKLIVDSYHSQKFLLKKYPYVLTNQ